MSSQFAKGKLKLIKESLAAKDWAAVQKQATSVAQLRVGLPTRVSTKANTKLGFSQRPPRLRAKQLQWVSLMTDSLPITGPPRGLERSTGDADAWANRSVSLPTNRLADACFSHLHCSTRTSSTRLRRATRRLSRMHPPNRSHDRLVPTARVHRDSRHEG